MRVVFTQFTAFFIYNRHLKGFDNENFVFSFGFKDFLFFFIDEQKYNSIYKNKEEKKHEMNSHICISIYDYKTVTIQIVWQDIKVRLDI